MELVREGAAWLWKTARQVEGVLVTIGLWQHLAAEERWPSWWEILAAPAGARATTQLLAEEAHGARRLLGVVVLQTASSGLRAGVGPAPLQSASQEEDEQPHA